MTALLVGPGRLDIENHQAGDTVAFSCAMEGDQSAYTWTAVIRELNETDTPLTVDQTGADAGVVIVSLNTATTAGIVPGRHHWSLRRSTLTTGNTVLAGEWTTVNPNADG